MLVLGSAGSFSPQNAAMAGRPGSRLEEPCGILRFGGLNLEPRVGTSLSRQEPWSCAKAKECTHARSQGARVVPGDLER